MRMPGGKVDFGVVYDDAVGFVTLAPAFDLVTTSAYLPHDNRALTLDGTKRWPEAKRLVRFGVQRCQLTATAAKTVVAEVAEAVAQVSRGLDTLTDLDPHAKDVGDRMRAAWMDGLRGVKLGAGVGFESTTFRL